MLDSLRFPGFDNLIPAVGEVELTTTETFFVSEISPGVYQTTFTLSTPIPSLPGSPNALPDEELLRLYVNKVPAGVIVDSATQFTIVSPNVVADDRHSGVLFPAVKPDRFAGSATANQCRKIEIPALRLPAESMPARR